MVQSCSVKKLFLEFSQSSQENACVRVSFLIKLEAWGILFVNCFRKNSIEDAPKGSK